MFLCDVCVYVCMYVCVYVCMQLPKLKVVSAYFYVKYVCMCVCMFGCDFEYVYVCVNLV